MPLVAQVDLDAPAGEPLDDGEDAGVAVVRLLVPQELFPPDVESGLDRGDAFVAVDLPPHGVRTVVGDVGVELAAVTGSSLVR
ncbi:MAG: hypothetical protein JWO67_5262 [Streptosporangiaceae bacterium]|nr:hypothetical protein [Streptosporangiaceae bacterium]